jgi:deoxyadenosine/deoxycytidine kinase
MPYFFIIEAVIGAGKSTLLTQLVRVLSQRGLRVQAITEPVDLWHSTGALQAFYEDVAGKAYEFQTFAYATRCTRVREVVDQNPDTDIFIMERSVISDRYLFVQLLQDDEKFSPLQCVMFDYWHRLWDHLLPFQKPTAFIYLAPSLESTLQRIKTRNRTGETVTREYQTALQERHEAIFGTGIAPRNQTEAVMTIVPGVPVLRMYSDDDYRFNDLHPFIQRIVAFIEKNLL